MLTRRQMNRRAMALAAAGLLGGSRLAETGEAAIVPRGYKLVWADNFNRTGRPDPKNWGFEHGFVRNHELQWYQPQNAECRDGFLFIEARRQQVRNTHYRAGSRHWQTRRPFAHYTSASLTTRGRRSWRYGVFAMRGRINTHPGMWPAWWMLGDNKPWPACGEIDIMEYYAGHINANVGWQNPNGTTRWKSVFTHLTKFHDPDWSNQFHLWVMHWEPEFIRLYLDGQLMNQVDLRQTVEPRYGRFNPFHQKAYMILNLAVGGAGGNPAHTVFPGIFQVDYVRVYQGEN